MVKARRLALQLALVEGPVPFTCRDGTIWTFPTGGAIAGAPAIVDGIAYFSNRQHRIYGVNAVTGRQVFRFPDGAFVPVSGNGRRLLLHGFSRLYAVEPRRR